VPDPNHQPWTANQALEDYAELPMKYDVSMPRIWELRYNLTAYDACYVALAEALDAPLLTCDRALASAPGHRATYSSSEKLPA
jgi:predicted nucleic acid-binding protein